MFMGRSQDENYLGFISHDWRATLVYERIEKYTQNVSINYISEKKPIVYANVVSCIILVSAIMYMYLQWIIEENIHIITTSI